MKYVVNISPETISEIESLIQKGDFASVTQFIDVAIQNQINMEQRIPGPLVGSTEAAKGVRNLVVQTNQTEFLINNQKTPKLSSDRPRPEPGPIWGLYNRVFPVKISLRTLTNILIAKAEDSVPLPNLALAASASASIVAKKLQRLDKAVGNPHGEKLATALPVKSLDRTIKRFQEMFVGSITSAGHPGGFPQRLGFVSIGLDGEGRPIVSLTKPGWEFARLANPILDKEEVGAGVRPFSDEERTYLMRHLQSRLPDEYKLMTSIIKHLGDSMMTPTDVDAIISQVFPELSASELDSTRSGVMSRMVELGLARRVRRGLNVSYSPAGNAS